MKVAVIGVGGVGMAHVCAASRLGYSVTALVDKNPTILDAARRRWRNTFDGVTEEVDVQKNCEFHSIVPEQPPPADIVILATPPHLAESLAPRAADAWPSALLLCEKPLWLSPRTRRYLGERLRLSAEWVHLGRLRESLEHSTSILLTAGAKTATTDWGYQLTMLSDWGPHVASLLAVHLPPTTDYGWEELHSALDKFTGVLRYGERRYQVVGTRGAGLPFAWYFKNRTVGWMSNLFDLQLALPPYGLAGQQIDVVMDITNGRRAE